MLHHVYGAECCAVATGSGCGQRAGLWAPGHKRTPRAVGVLSDSGSRSNVLDALAPDGGCNLARQWPIVHACGFDGNTSRLRRAFHGFPCIRCAFEGMPADATALAPVAEGRVVASKPGALGDGWEAHAMVRLLRGSRHLRSLKEPEESAKDIIDASFPSEMLEQLGRARERWPARACLQRARARFDMACMVGMRVVFRALANRAPETPPVDFFVFMDGSPVSGFEAFAVVEQQAQGDDFSERIMPLTYLGFGHMRTADKIFGWLWCLCLESGTDIGLLRWRLSRVRGVCTGSPGFATRRISSRSSRRCCACARHRTKHIT